MMFVLKNNNVTKMLTLERNVDFLKTEYSKHVVVNLSILLMGIKKNQDSLHSQFQGI